MAEAAPGAYQADVPMRRTQDERADEFVRRGSADHRVGDSLFEFLLRSELRNGNAVDRGFRYERNHRRVAVAADDHAVDVVDVGARSLGQVALETRRVECAAHADDAVLRKARRLERQIGQRIHRVGDHDDDGAGRIFHHVLDHALHDVGVGAYQLLARHARLAGNTRGDDYHVRIGGLLIVVGDAHELGVEIHQRRALVHVQHLAFRKTFLDVDQDDFARNFAASHHICAGCANGTCTYYCNFRHSFLFFVFSLSAFRNPRRSAVRRTRPGRTS